MQNTIQTSTRLEALLDPIIIPEDMAFLDSGIISTPATVSDHKATFIRIPFAYTCGRSYEKAHVGKDQEKAQSEKDSHSKNRGGKKPN